MKLDKKDQAILADRVAARSAFSEPQVGDFILFGTGQIERISYVWPEGVQTSPLWAGSFYLGAEGHASFSGGLNPSVKTDSLTLAPVVRNGAFWFFHHGEAGAHRGVNAVAPCRVYYTDEEYRGFLKPL